MIAWLLAAALVPAWAGAPYGIILMAHGGAPQWNDEVQQIAIMLSAQAPVETAFGMADAQALQRAASNLKDRGAGKIVAVPLFINSASEVMDQTRFVLGLREKPSAVFKEGMIRMAQAPGGHAAHMGMTMPKDPKAFSTRVRTELPVVVTPALDDHPYVADVLIERAKALSREPKNETILLVGHGPVDDKANKEWLKTMEALAARVKSEGGYREAHAATVRDDSVSSVKAQAATALRALVVQGSKGGGRVIVIPYLIARGGIEEHITKILDGLDYGWDGAALCPHPYIARWAAEVAREGAKKDNMRRFK